MTEDDEEFARIERAIDREQEALIEEMRRLLDRRFAEFPDHARHYCHGAAVITMIADIVVNIDCEPCRDHVVAHVAKSMPRVLREADAQAAGREGEAHSLH
jgi:hypothetical protein